MSKIVDFSPKDGLKKGLDTVANAVKVTIGPRGKNVILDNTLRPTIANEGGLIAREINLSEPLEQMGAQIIKEVIHSTSDDVGGGRTATAILTQALVDGGLDIVKDGANINKFKKGMKDAAKDIEDELDKMSKPVKDDMLKQVATISTESEELGAVIAETIDKIGKDGIVTVEESNKIGIESEIAEGLKFDKGWISPYMVNNQRGEAEYKDIPVLIVKNKVTQFEQIQPTLDKIRKRGENKVLIICEDMEGEALNTVIVSKLKGVFNTLAVKIPGLGDMKNYTLDDLCALTGATAVSEHEPKGQLGLAKKVISSKDYTIIIGAGDIKEHIANLNAQRNMCNDKWEIDQYDERIAKLTDGIAVIKVGTSSETETKYLKLKVEDGVNETKRALEEGVVIGGNCSFIHAAKKYKSIDDTEYGKGYNLVINSVEAPLSQIIKNGQGNIDNIEKIRKSTLTTGYDSLQNEVVKDMYALGIIDAVKVVKTVLRNAVSAASMFLSIDVAVVDEKETNNS